jgi:hypothetical protein
MPSKLKLKVGELEVEYEGEATFTAETIKDLLSHLDKLSGPRLAAGPKAGTATANAAGADSGKPPPASGVLESASNVAAHLKVGKGPELVVAAAAYLQFAQNKANFTRAELTTTMRQAPAYFQENYVSNLTATLKRLVGAKKLNQIGNDTYALNASEAQNLEGRLAG